MIGSGQDAAAEPGAAGLTIDPRGRVLPCAIGFFGDCKEFIQALETDVLGLECEAGNAAQLQRRREDQAGEPRPPIVAV
jgi:hypothetical protein